MKPLAALFAGAIITFAMTAPASARNDSYEIRVPYGDLNLNVDAGADTFLNRLDRAARGACSDNTNRVSMSQETRVRECSVNFTQRGVVQLDHQHVTYRYLERGGTLPTVDVASV